MNRVVLSLGLVTVFLSPLRGQSLDQDPLIHYYFSEEEVGQLQSVIHLFDEHVKRNCSKTIAECLAKYLSAVSFIEDTTLQGYLDPIEASGYLSFSMAADLLLNHAFFDLASERNRQ
ncbi:MAG: hypothetical protein AAF944_17725 [Bacteroidota bacterium]